jgi:hypothetical protein
MRDGWSKLRDCGGFWLDQPRMRVDSFSHGDIQDES